MGVIELDAHYLLADDEHTATLLLSGDLSLEIEDEYEGGNPDGFLTTIHELFDSGFSSYDHRGRFAVQMQVKHGESLTLIARREGKIVASLVNEIDTLTTSRVLLKPKGGFHLIIHQRRCFEPDQVRVMGLLAPAYEQVEIAASLGEIVIQARTPATQALAELLAAVKIHYAATTHHYPQVLQLLLLPLEQAIEANEEAGSREALGYICTACETLNIKHLPYIGEPYEVAVAVGRRP